MWHPPKPRGGGEVRLVLFGGIRLSAEGDSSGGGFGSGMG